MARYTQAVCRMCRREGQKLFLKGDRCYGAKCAVTRRGTPPGMHKQSRRRASEYCRQLREKQKARRTYGMLEKQFHGYFVEAERKRGITGDNLFILLESRLDNVVYRMGFCASRAQARQLVTHGHFTVNGKKVSIPSYLIKADDVVAVKQQSRSMNRFSQVRESGQVNTPAWMSFDADNLTGTVLRIPGGEDIDTELEKQLIVELYSR
ncbi:MAG: 30S ribosomal protein S4 [Clostridia bacterium]|nr:30S ribosomal protein S4 [Clostridia bacterium]